MQQPIVNRTLPEEPPPPQSRVKKIAAAIAVGVMAVGVAAGYLVFDTLVNRHSTDRVMSVVTLDDGVMLALEETTSVWRRKDPVTEQIVDEETLKYRLRRYQAASGQELARREVGGAPECIAAVAGRAWCRWEKT